MRSIRSVLVTALVVWSLPLVGRASSEKLHRAPMLVYAPAPTYSDQGRAARVQGSVLLEAKVDVEGSVTAIRLIKGLPLGLSERAIDAVRKWRYLPATSNGQSVAAPTEIKVEFRLDRMIGWVYDPATELTWTERDNGKAIDFAAARRYCNRLKTTQSKNWRLPSLEELRQLYDPARATTFDCSPEGRSGPSSLCATKIDLDLSSPLLVSSSEDTGNTATSWMFELDTGSAAERLRSHAGEHQRAVCVTSTRARGQ